MHTQVLLHRPRDPRCRRHRTQRTRHVCLRRGRADAQRNIPEVTHRRRGVSDLRRRREILRAPAPHRVEKVRHVRDDATFAGEFLDHLAAQIVRRAADEPRQRAAFAMRHHAHAQPARLIHVAHPGLRRQAARFENHRRCVVVVDRDLRIRRLRRIVMHIASPHPEHPLRWSVRSHHPPRHIEDVHAVVAQFAVARRPRPVPIVVQRGALQREHWRRPTKHIVIHPVRIPRRFARDRIAFPIIGRVHVVQFSEPTFVQKFDPRRESVLRTILRSHLYNTPVLRRRLHHLAPLPHRVAHGLFDIDVLPGLTRPHGQQRVPMIRRHDEHRVHIRARQHRPRIRARKRRRGPRLQTGLSLRHLLRINIAQRDDPHILPHHELLDVRLRLGATSDNPEPHRLVGPDRRRPRGRLQTGGQRTGSGYPGSFH